MAKHFRENYSWFSYKIVIIDKKISGGGIKCVYIIDGYKPHNDRNI